MVRWVHQLMSGRAVGTRRTDGDRDADRRHGQVTAADIGVGSQPCQLISLVIIIFIVVVVNVVVPPLQHYNKANLNI